MALNYDITNVKDAWHGVHSDFVEENERSIFAVPTILEDDGKVMAMDSIVHSMIFLTMSIGINEVKKSNSQRVFNRIRFLEKISGGSGMFEGNPFEIEWVDRCIGLKTNASLLTKAQFIRNHTKRLEL